MDERFRQLAEQAGVDFFSSTDPEFCGREYCEAWTEQLQEFALLIVRECAKFTDSKMVFDDNSGECLNWVEGSNLLEHFGVE